MLAITDAGGIVVPPFPAFYQNPDSIEELVSSTVARALSHAGVEVDHDEWDGLSG
jgi:4-hydroxy-3-polyprenylbenzoate decarboxylase